MRIINNVKETNNDKALREIVRRAFYKNENKGTYWLVDEIEIVGCKWRHLYSNVYIVDVKLNVHERYRLTVGLPEGEEKVGYKEYYLQIVAYTSRDCIQKGQFDWADADCFGYDLYKASPDKSGNRSLVGGAYTRPRK